MNINFRGLIDLHHIPSSEPLLPLYESIVNSIQSIEDANISDGIIEIKLKREPQITLSSSWETDIDSIEIIDNGIGFTDDNYESFNTYASDYKWERGCKGVGRIMWLKAFYDVNVESSYDDNGRMHKRKFNFNAQDSVKNMIVDELNDPEIKRETKVTLNSLSSKLKKSTPKKLNTIARGVLKHCFVYFVLDKAPKIVINDEKDSISINQLFDEYKKENIKTQEFYIKGIEFQIIHAKNFNFGSSINAVNLCAHKRTVISSNLSSYLNINSCFTSENGDFTYEGYILSKYLDDAVNRERTAFNMPISDETIIDDIAESEIYDNAYPLISEFLKGEIQEHRAIKLASIENYVFTKNPRYRILLKNFPECVDAISLTDDEEKLEIELFKQEQLYKLKLKTDGIELEKTIGTETDFKKATQKKAKYLEKISELGKSSLAEYIIHRKTVLHILDENLKYSNAEEKSYVYEENIHQIVFPMQNTSDDIDYQSHNLWIIDEKLAYHYYLASDKSLNSMTSIVSESDKEPDIIIFDKPFAFTDENKQPFGDITIIEFKRPGRNYYTKNDDPIQQVIDYMEDITSGKIRTKDGVSFEGRDSMRFFCYILCSMDEKMHKFAKQRDFKNAPDGMGYYKYFDSYKAYVEVVPYTKMVQNSKQRNQILFDKLFMR